MAMLLTIFAAILAVSITGGIILKVVTSYGDTITSVFGILLLVGAVTVFFVMPIGTAIYAGDIAGILNTISVEVVTIGTIVCMFKVMSRYSA